MHTLLTATLLGGTASPAQAPASAYAHWKFRVSPAQEKEDQAVQLFQFNRMEAAMDSASGLSLQRVAAFAGHRLLRRRHAQTRALISSSSRRSSSCRCVRPCVHLFRNVHDATVFHTSVCGVCALVRRIATLITQTHLMKATPARYSRRCCTCLRKVHCWFVVPRLLRRCCS